MACSGRRRREARGGRADELSADQPGASCASWWPGRRPRSSRWRSGRPRQQARARAAGRGCARGEPRRPCRHPPVRARGAGDDARPRARRWPRSRPSSPSAGRSWRSSPPTMARCSAASPAGRRIGGVFACNLAGPRRLKAGAARDHLLGLHCVTGHGQEIKTGGRVVKNVTGYDLCKLLTGSYGTLAVLTEVTFKVMPRAETEPHPARHRPRRAEPCWPCCAPRPARRARSRVPPTCRRWRPAGRRSASCGRAARGVAAIRLEGFGPSIAYRSELLQKLLAGPGIDFAQLGHGGHRRALARDPRRARC